MRFTAVSHIHRPRSDAGKIVLLCLVGPALLLSGCKKTAPQAATEPTKPAERKALPPAGPKVEACALVSKEDVAAVQQAPMSDANSTEVPTADFTTSQCYYDSSTPNCSVTIAIVQRDPNGAGIRSIHESWDDAFGRFRDSDKVANKEGRRDEAEREAEAKKRGTPAAKPNEEDEEEKGRVHPSKVADLGEEAYWSTTAVGGVLYALQGEKIVRVSCGGPAKIEEKLERSKQLAQKAIAALPK